MGIACISTAMVLAGAALAACSDDTAGDRNELSGAGSPRSTANSASATTSSPAGRSQSALIKTHVVGFDGAVLAGSVLGDAAFCPGGKVHHAQGSPDIGFPAINVFMCGDSELRIGFGPGPDQMNERIQTSSWRVLRGTGAFAGATGSGRMRVVWRKVGGSDGRETFTGTVVIP